MVIMTAKLPKRRTLLIIALCVLAVVVLALCLRGADTDGETPQPPAAADTNEARIDFLAGFGWQVEPEPVQQQQVRVPSEPGEVFLRYNELQRAQGYDLLQYQGQELTRCVYRITNYPQPGTYYATLLLLDGKIVGADVASSAKDGVMHTLTYPQ